MRRLRRLCCFCSVGSVSMSVSFPVVVVVVVVVGDVNTSSSYRSLPLPDAGLVMMLVKFETLPPNGVINLLGVELPELFRLVSADPPNSGVISPAGMIGPGSTIGRSGSTGLGWWLAGRERTLKPVLGEEEEETAVGAGGGAGMASPSPIGSCVRKFTRSLLGMPMMAVWWWLGGWVGGSVEEGNEDVKGWLLYMVDSLAGELSGAHQPGQPEGVMVG